MSESRGVERKKKGGWQEVEGLETQLEHARHTKQGPFWKAAQASKGHSKK